MMESLADRRPSGKVKWSFPFAPERVGGYLWLLVLCHLLLPPAPSAEPMARLAGLNDEMMLFQQVPSVFSASKYAQKVTEAPSAVSVVTAEEIRKYGYRTLADLLRGLRSFHLISDRINDLAGVRGFNRPGDTNSRILLLINGHRVNDSIFGAATVGDIFLLDIDLVERVEVVRGPSSSLYGASAFFGVVNVITRRGRDLEGLEAAADARSHDTYRGRLSYGIRPASGPELLLSGTWFESDGKSKIHYPEFDTPETNHGVAEKGERREIHSLFAGVGLGELRLEGAYVKSDKHFSTAPYGTIFNDDGNRLYGYQGYGLASYERQVNQDLGLTARLSYNVNKAEGYYYYDFSAEGGPSRLLNKDRFRGAWWGAEVSVTRMLPGDHRLIVGGEFQDNFRQDLKNSDLQVHLDSRNDSENWGIYLQDAFPVAATLSFNLGLRHDHYSTFGGTTNPRLALIYAPSRNSSYKLLFGSAFRAPNAFESFYHDGMVSQKPNPDLDPERITTYEVVMEHLFNEELRGVISLYRYEIDDLINLNVDPQDGLIFFDNLDEVEGWGAELEIEGKWPSGREGRISYSFQQAENEITGDRLSNSPEHLAKLGLIQPLVDDRLFLALEEQYTSERLTIFGRSIGGYAVTNLTLFAQDLIDELELTASVFNLFDKRFSDPAPPAHRQSTLEQDGRVFRFEIRYLF